MEALRLEHLSRSFGGVQALQDISFNVEVGEKLAIIGPNGAGKTTLFNILNGQLSTTAGRIYFFGQEINALPTHRRAHLGQARAFQLTSLFLNLTVLDNMLLAIQGTKASRFQMLRPNTTYTHLFVKAEELLKSMALWEKRNDLVKAIAYGEQRKLEIALSLASEPKLLLLDEPNTGLTPAEGVGVVDMIRNLGKDITILLVAHDMDLVFGFADRIMVLHYGRIIADGTPKEIQTDLRVKEIYIGPESRSINVKPS